MFAVGPTTSVATDQQQHFAVASDQSAVGTATASAPGASAAGTTASSGPGSTAAAVTGATSPPTNGTAAATTAATNVSTPSSLTGFLAPGGQLPVHKDGGAAAVPAASLAVTGKPSIVKVTLTPPVQQQPGQQQLQQPQPQHPQPQHQLQQRHNQHHHHHQQQQHQLPADEQPVNPKLTHPKLSAASAGPSIHRQAYQLPPVRSTDSFQSTPFRTSSATDWYYANYNRTNVEPFVSKTSASGAVAVVSRATAVLAAVTLLVALPEFRF